MNSNIEHELESDKEGLEKVCAWLKCYEGALSKGFPLDDYVEMGCYLCNGKPYMCDGYFPSNVVKSNYNGMKLNELI